MQIIPKSHRDLLEDGTKAYAFLSTVMPDGSPQVTPLWFNTDGDDILVNSKQGRVKDRNMRARPKVAVLIMRMGDPNRYLQVRGKVIEITSVGAEDHIDALSQKYTGGKFNLPSDHVRVKYRIRPEKISVE